MKSLFRVIALWLMLVALPFQGFASASMLLCATANPAQAAKAAAQAAPGADHDHAAMLAAGQQAGEDGAHCAGSTHNGAMSDCCVGAALSYALPQPASHLQLAERLRLPEPVAPPPVDLALPKRPPRAILA